MAWQQRHGKRCYYRCVRTDRGPRQVYIGSGPRAEEIAQEVEQRRRDRERDRATLGAERARTSDAEGRLVELNVLTTALLRAELHHGGYRLHKGQWRKSMKIHQPTMSAAEDQTNDNLMDRPPFEEHEEPDWGEEIEDPEAADEVQERPKTMFTRKDAIREMNQRASAGSESALHALHDLMDRHPEIWGHLGDMATIAERSWLDVIATNDALARESIRRRLDKLKIDLAGENPCPLETLLCNHVALSWVAAQDAEAQASRAMEVSPGQARFRLTQAESAQRRFLAASRTLALLRSTMARGLRPLQVFEPSRKMA